MKLSLLALIASLAGASPLQAKPAIPIDAKVSYDGYHVFSITPSSVQEARELETRFARYHSHHTRNAFAIVIPPEEVVSFHKLQLNARLENPDLGAYIRDTDRVPTYKRDIRKRARGELPDLSWFDTYHNYADHLEFWDDLVRAFPKNARKFSAGKSYEGREIQAFHFFGKQRKLHGLGSDHAVEKPVILWHATVHAREWVSTMVSSHTSFFHVGIIR